MQALKNDEYLIKEFRVNANTVILYIKNIFNRIFGIAYFNFGCFIAMVLKRIGYKVYKQLADEGFISRNNRHRFHGYCGSGFLYIFFQQLVYILHHIIDVGSSKTFFIGAYS